jgi:geranylgeranyl diphosphate synthase, type I
MRIVVREHDVNQAVLSDWIGAVARRVHALLEQLFAEKRAQARALSPLAEELVQAIAELTLRGGKRLRPATAYAAFRAVRGAADPEAVLEFSVALELLQSYLLIQDDWMDGDDARRGGPAVHAAFGARFGDAHLGASLAMLASDLASGFSWELLAAAPFPAGRTREAFAAFGRMHAEVLYGQQLDLLAHDDLERTHDLKTGSYTVRGPLQLGALLGDASPDQLAALERFGTPLGVAFQLRDDLLGAFGDRAVLGKPAGIDIRRGRPSRVVAEARQGLSAVDRAHFDRAFGDAEATDEAVLRAHELLLDSGARERIESKLAQLVEQARAGLTGAPLDPTGSALLEDLAQRLTQRNT